MSTNSNQAIARMMPGYPIRQYLKRPKSFTLPPKEPTQKAHLPPKNEDILTTKEDPYKRTPPKAIRKPCRSCGGGSRTIRRSYLGNRGK